MIAPVSAIWSAAPWTTVKAPSVPVVSPLEVASIVTEPTSWPVTAFVATPSVTVALPVPVTVPAPDALANATTVVSSLVTVLPAASLRVAVSARAAPEVRLAVEPVRTISAAAPWTTTKLSVPVVRPLAVASMFTVPSSAPVTVLVATPLEAVAVPVPVTVPSPPAWSKSTTVRVVGGDGVAGRVLQGRGQDAGRAGGEIARRAGQDDVGGGAVDDGEGAERAGRQAARRGFHRDASRRARR